MLHRIPRFHPVNFKKRVGFFLLRLLIALAVAWLVGIAAASQIYINLLTHPACYRMQVIPDGYTVVTFQASDGTPVRGWWHDADNGTLVVLLAGQGGSSDASAPDAEMLVRHGYGVLALDARSCSGRMATLGVREVEDLRAAVRFALERPGVRRLAVMGFSAGGVTAIRGAARMEQIRVVIVEGNYASMWHEINANGSRPLSLGWQIEHATAGLLWLETGAWPAGVSPLLDLPRLNGRPVLLIHGEYEAGRNLAQAQFAAAVEPKELWIVPGANHGQYRTLAAAALEKRIIGFLDRYAR